MQQQKTAVVTMTIVRCGCLAVIGLKANKAARPTKTADLNFIPDSLI